MGERSTVSSRVTVIVVLKLLVGTVARTVLLIRLFPRRFGCFGLIRTIHSFTAKYKELIIICLSDTANGDTGKGGLTSEEWVSLNTKLKGTKDLYAGIADTGVDLTSLPLSKLISSEQARVLIIIDNDTDAQPSNGIFGPKNFPHEDSYSNTNNQPKMAVDQLAKLKEKRNLVADQASLKDDGFHLLSWTLTTQTSDFVFPATIAGYAVGKVLDPLFWKAYNAFTPASYPTVIYVDYVG